jgi:hypothetical protein
MQTNLEKIYHGKGVVYVPTEGLCAIEVIKRIARHIHLEDYQEYNCQSKLLNYMK